MKNKTQKGAASVLVIFIILILSALGMFAISAANINYKFSQKALAWNKMYYDLDAKGEQLLAVLDGELAKAEALAEDYIAKSAYAKTSSEDLPKELQSAIYLEYNTINEVFSGNNIDSYKKNVFNKVYMYFADNNLNQLAGNFNNLKISAMERGGYIEGFEIKAAIESESDESDEYDGCGLNIAVWVEPFETGGSRYRVEEWSEWQKPAREEEGISIWNPNFESE